VGAAYFPQAIWFAKSQHGPALPGAPLLLVGAPVPGVPPPPAVPGVNATIGMIAGVLA
jgi:hypothetical protein